VAQASADPASGPVPLQVQFTGSSSTDPDNDTLSYQWAFGDGSTSTAANPSHTYSAKGTYAATLTVSDGHGHTGSKTLRISAGNTPPRPVITAPASYRDGAGLALQGSADDTEDGALPASAFSWNVRLQHGSLHSHPELQQDGVEDVSLTTSTDHDVDSYYIAELTVTDNDGLAATATAEIHPESGQVRLLSEPAGAPLAYGSREVTAPFEAPTAIGLHTSASAGESFTTFGGHRFGFDSWADGGPRSRQLTVPPGGFTLTARYRDLTPAPAATGPVLAPDRSGPRLSYKRFDPARGAVEGGARDASGVRSVQVAVGRAVRGGRCLWWLRVKRRLSRDARPCSKPAWIAAALSGSSKAPSWRALLRRSHVPAGGYRLLFRAVDAKGNVSRLLTTGTGMAKVQVVR
jgi:PKD repeat protein